MSIDRIERDTLIAAPIERVWTLVSDPGFWVADEANRAGAAAVEGQSTVARHTEHGDFPIRVEKVEPPTYVAYRWVSAFPGQPLREENSTLVEFTLSPEGDKTRLRVVETGFGELPTTDDNRRNVIKDHTAGWSTCMEALRERAEQPTG